MRHRPERPVEKIERVRAHVDEVPVDTEREAAGDAERKVAALTMDPVRKLDADQVPFGTSEKRLACRSNESTSASTRE